MRKSILFALAAALLLVTPMSASAVAPEVISLHRSYQLVTPASAGYPDADYKLTDGKYSMPVESGETSFYYKSDAYVGFNHTDLDENGNFVILLDLAALREDLAYFEVSLLNETDVGIFAPKSIVFEVSESESGGFTKVGKWLSSEPVSTGISHPLIAFVEPSEPVKGRYVKISIEHLGEYTNESGESASAGWVFIDEISVHGPAEYETSAESSAPEESPPNTGDIGILPFVLIGIGSGLIIWSMLRGRRSKEA